MHYSSYVCLFRCVRADVLDSISWNVKALYKAAISERIVEAYCHAFKWVDSEKDRVRLFRMLKMWQKSGHYDDAQLRPLFAYVGPWVERQAAQGTAEAAGMQRAMAEFLRPRTDGAAATPVVSGIAGEAVAGQGGGFQPAASDPRLRADPRLSTAGAGLGVAAPGAAAAVPVPSNGGGAQVPVLPAAATTTVPAPTQPPDIDRGRLLIRLVADLRVILKELLSELAAADAAGAGGAAIFGGSGGGDGTTSGNALGAQSLEEVVTSRPELLGLLRQYLNVRFADYIKARETSLLAAWHRRRQRWIQQQQQQQPSGIVGSSSDAGKQYPEPAPCVPFQQWDDTLALVDRVMQLEEIDRGVGGDGAEGKKEGEDNEMAHEEKEENERGGGDPAVGERRNGWSWRDDLRRALSSREKHDRSVSGSEEGGDAADPSALSALHWESILPLSRERAGANGVATRGARARGGLVSHFSAPMAALDLDDTMGGNERSDVGSKSSAGAGGEGNASISGEEGGNEETTTVAMDVDAVVATPMSTTTRASFAELAPVPRLPAMSRTGAAFSFNAGGTNGHRGSGGRWATPTLSQAFALLYSAGDAKPVQEAGQARRKRRREQGSSAGAGGGAAGMAATAVVETRDAPVFAPLVAPGEVAAAVATSDTPVFTPLVAPGKAASPKTSTAATAAPIVTGMGAGTGPRARASEAESSPYATVPSLAIVGGMVAGLDPATAARIAASLPAAATLGYEPALSPEEDTAAMSAALDAAAVAAESSGAKTSGSGAPATAPSQEKVDAVLTGRRERVGDLGRRFYVEGSVAAAQSAAAAGVGAWTWREWMKKEREKERLQREEEAEQEADGEKSATPETAVEATEGTNASSELPPNIAAVGESSAEHLDWIFKTLNPHRRQILSGNASRTWSAERGEWECPAAAAAGAARAVAAGGIGVAAVESAGGGASGCESAEQVGF